MELEDAGRIDGASELGIFHRIMLPIAVPGAMTMGIFAFIGIIHALTKSPKGNPAVVVYAIFIQVGKTLDERLKETGQWFLTNKWI